MYLINELLNIIVVVVVEVFMSGELEQRSLQKQKQVTRAQIKRK